MTILVLIESMFVKFVLIACTLSAYRETITALNKEVFT